ncbi:MAG: 4Fe-4S dicluster domain-containing protein [Candidatus Celaenobacter antarcticus]|nr:4Fe-4S dicluster domain-containing protein [Candidatus Celaenobacter antarcticus]MDP8315451.1 4Fe-4S dicluster domain-containing protein [Candidatus Celaenobacter antarcticus]
MSLKITREKIKNSLVDKIEEISGQNVFDCYQCGMCSSGCPVTDYMDYSPNQVMRLVQLGSVDEILNSRTIWICSTCLQCSTRCPKGIDVAKVMEALRTINLRQRECTLKPEDLKLNDLRDLPPIALVSAFRKLTG